jgi:2-oxoglutarate dehydrogenase E2 component (dihydrolipoamide succinyltransferase)
MSVEIKVPTLPESVADATVAKWYKKEGEYIERDENLVDLETDKVMLEVPAPHSGVIEKISASEGDVVGAEHLLAVIDDSVKQPEKSAEPAKAASVEAPATNSAAKETSTSSVSLDDLSPAVRRLVTEKGLDVSQIMGSGKGGRITKQDVENFIKAPQPAVKSKSADAIVPMGSRTEKRVPMSRLRARVAERLVQVQQEAAILTTFNEVNMKPVMDLRKKYKDQFEKSHGVRLGFMSFFTRAAVEALKRYPAVNASIDGNDLIYHNYYDVGIAIGSERGLVVPILRNVEIMSLADIEKEIRGYAAKAQNGKLALEDLQGGTFTITNGGTFGSMLSTPIINPPQTGILGMHNIVERPIVENGEIVARPVMYIALSYDHRVIDGREAVLFLRTIKEILEDPARMLLGV